MGIAARVQIANLEAKLNMNEFKLMGFTRDCAKVDILGIAVYLK
jgi:hypothetical protein